MNNLGVKYSTLIKGNQITFCLESRMPTINKIILGGFLFFILLCFLSIAFFLADWSAVLIAVATFLFLLLFCYLLLRLFRVSRLIILDKNNQTIESTADSFKKSFSEIKDIVITEQMTWGSSVNFLKLQLINGEKTLSFPFRSFDQAQNALEIIKKTIKTPSSN